MLSDPELYDMALVVIGAGFDENGELNYWGEGRVATAIGMSSYGNISIIMTGVLTNCFDDTSPAR